MQKNELKAGIQWNLVSYCFLGVFTIISYLLIIWNYGKAELGAYNIVLSAFMICGHIGVLGMQSAALYFVPRLSEDKIKLGEYFSSFLAIAFITGLFLAIVIYFVAPIIGEYLFASEYVCSGLRTAAPAIIFFSVNKLIAGFINGSGRMAQFALLQGARYLFIVLCIGLNSILCYSFAQIFYAFLISEAGVFVLGVMFLKKIIVIRKPKFDVIISGICFGSQAMLGNVISDINTRIDVMMLGVLCGDSTVGLYSFVTIIAEGLFSILFVFRNNYNPHFAELLFQGKKEELSLLLNQQKRYLMKIFSFLGIIILTGYFFFCLLLLENTYRISILSVAAILTGCIIMAPYFVAGNICTLDGKPHIDSCITLTTIIANIIINYLLISVLGMIGASLATSVSYILFSLLTSLAIKRCVHI